MLTRTLDRIYTAAGALAGVFLVLICVIVTAQIVARQLETIIPSADQFAGFCLAATSFLGLAYSFRSGSHIRVTLFTQLLRGPGGRLALILALAVGAAIAATLAWHTSAMVAQNFARGEVTSGLVPVPLWIPQIGMALGVILFAVAIVEDLVRAILGHQTLFDAAERKLKDAQEAGEPVDPV
ncbi:tripartite ATP-independent periplasmic transporter DctQ component [Dinoroseobacter shibae DFL 12 = DSM 16493]|jgi:TRAP-type C4-dicarboxylate transport system permease small subunit|uniref:TRAP transporter small permease protein n=2 Tax=Pseudomonadota TaxID=1224 RepID=A8LSG4_DINSH|nr:MULTISPECIES: TRAP transporter small permease [Dinoroseobacter]ABV92778.1 tripartite ATP-independent periplasmic transporter DctQ component [Dinoroseobacter shibae DFL 12 = DSM 16493]MDD9715878.1 TRAP transporter small permease [Dinoroseobacter sp. PD6]URF47721.1 TRAP transporter small permease [Dinoroseobacter shibae]URF52031.1 TRAP transporter small permease [Dinoroseobacter shibae]